MLIPLSPYTLETKLPFSSGLVLRCLTSASGLIVWPVTVLLFFLHIPPRYSKWDIDILARWVLGLAIGGPERSP